MLNKVISGGQTGVDTIGLKAAVLAGIPTGGTAPAGWKTENGPRPILADFGLKTCNSYDYKIRTEINVADSDGTVLFGDMKTPGCGATLNYIRRHKKPYICNPTVEQLVEFVIKNSIMTLNVAGNRGSKLDNKRRLEFGAILLSSFKQIKQYYETHRSGE